MTRRGATRRREWPRLEVSLPTVSVQVWQRLVLGLCVIAGVALVGLSVRGLTPEQVRWTLDTELLFQSEDEVMAVVEQYADVSYWKLSLPEVEQSLAALPWIEQATLVRQWPDRVVVRVSEQTPLAYWNDSAFINSRGQVFGPSDLVFELPKLSGPDGRATDVMTHYLQFSQMFSAMGYRIDALDLAPRGAWTVQLDNGVEVRLGQKNILQRARRVARVLGETNDRAQTGNIAVMDARYQFGVAVEWKAETRAGESA
ncbi:cell division protein FtsQ/DivIB [Salinispirillum sp. LH 10-3-1]|uniref:Cell division protein FtsQ n=1 Tax=Salinispirillum sp. LH 10-3-1 TaxID=2952525 RepID=A0AB38YJG7_9GAMM